MRNVMLASIILVLSGALVGAASLMPEILDKLADSPPLDPHDFVLPTASEAVPEPETSGGGLPPSHGATAASTKAAAPVWAERIFTAGLSKDFGAVPHGTQLFHRFPLKNPYSVPVEITGLSVSCGCLTATRGKRILQSGESTTIDVAFDTREFTGPNSQTVRVGFGPYTRCVCVLTVSAVSQTDVLFKPDRVNFGNVELGQSSVQCTDIEYNGPLDWKIKEVIVAKALPVEATLSELVREPGKVCYRLTVTLKADVASGRIRDYIYLRTNQAGSPLMPLMVTANVQAARGVTQVKK